jgi:hypothetical protein
METTALMSTLDNPMLGCVREEREVTIRTNVTLSDILRIGQFHIDELDLKHCETEVNRALSQAEPRKIAATLFGFTDDYSMREQMVKLKTNHLQPADTVELLHYSVSHLNDLLNYRIYALGKIYMGSEEEWQVPLLESNKGQRWFRLDSLVRPVVPWRMLCVPLNEEFERRTHPYL